MAARARIGLLIIVATLIQTALGSDMRIAGVAPDLMVLLPISAGLVGGTEAGAWVGFMTGLFYDMFLTSTPVGLSALTYCLVGAGVGAVRVSVLQEHRSTVPLTALVATAGGVLVFVGVGDVFGQSQLIAGGRSWLIRVALIEAAWNAVLALPVSWLYARAARGSAGADRVGAPAGARNAAPAGVIGQRVRR